MQPIVFSRINSTLNRRMEACSLRTAYLLGGRPIIAGETCREIYFKRDRSKASLLLKLDMLISFYKSNDETCSAFVDVRKTLGQASVMKRKTREQIVAYRKLEQMILSCWETASSYLQDTIDASGFGVIRELEDEHIFGYLATGIDPEKAGEDEIKASDLMQLFVVDEEDAQLGGIYSTPELFFLGSEFLEESYIKPPVFSAMAPEAGNPASVYLHHCLTLPFINALTAAELRTVRAKLAGNTFCGAMDEWCNRCYDNEPPAGRLSVFRDNVFPAAVAMQQAIENNAILQLCRRQNSGHAPVEIWIGEMPVLQLWQYYRDFEVLTDETWKKLEAQKENPAYCAQRWPVMVLKSNEPLPAEQDEEARSVRKYLFVD